MASAYDAYPYDLGSPIPPTHGVYQARKGAEWLATCAARTADDATGYFHDAAPAGLGIDPVGVNVVRVASRYRQQ